MDTTYNGAAEIRGATQSGRNTSGNKERQKYERHYGGAETERAQPNSLPSYTLADHLHKADNYSQADSSHKANDYSQADSLHKANNYSQADDHCREQI